MEAKREKDALRMREYRKRIQEDKTILEDFMAFVAERDLELFFFRVSCETRHGVASRSREISDRI